MSLVLALIAGEHRLEGTHIPVDKFDGALLGEHIVAHRVIQPTECAQARYPERVREKTHVRHEVGIGRQPVFIAKAQHRQLETGGIGAREGFRDLRCELMDVEVGGIDDEVTGLAQSEHPLSFGSDTVKKRSVTLKRMGPPNLLEPPDQCGISRLKEEHANGSRLTERLNRLCEIGEQLAAPHIDDRGDLWQVVARLSRQLDQWTEHLGREIVDDIPAEVLQSIANRGSSGTGHAGDDEHFLLLFGLVVAVPGHRVVTPSLLCCCLRDKPTDQVTRGVSRRLCAR